MQKRVALYLRVSTNKGQTTKNQERELRTVAKRSGWSIAAIYADEGISGAKGREGRPGLDSLLKAVSRKEIDLVAAWSVDRLGRSLQDLVSFLNELNAKKVDLYLHQQGLDTTTPAGKAMFQVMGVFAEFERAIIRERIAAGLARAREEGRRLGRPRVGAEIEKRIREARGQGHGIRKVAKMVGCGVSVVQRLERKSTRRTSG
jgi:DNA invertase Pin-like site-specific DNA recombinase